MSAAEPMSLGEAGEALDDLLARRRSLVLATRGEGEAPEASYAPFVRDAEGGFHVFVSRLAAHAGNMLAHPRVGVMLIDDEAESRQIFARRRLTLDCRATPVDPDGPGYGPVLDALQARFGEVVGTLRELPDFVLLRLEPVAGRLVLGFGRAYAVEGPGLALSGPLGG